MRILCVAEKPSIAREVASILSGGRSQRRDSQVKYIKNYDFTFNFTQWGNCEVTMTSVLGHVADADFPSQYGWGRCRNNELFDCAIEVIHRDETQRRVAANITKEAQRCDYLYIWTDCDREGEAIGYEIYTEARKRNRRLDVAGQNVWRAHFSHLDRNHILKAANSPTALDMKQVKAVESRQEIDLRTGVAFTREMTTSLKSSSIIDKGSVVSYGTCQFPTLGFVVDRYRRVREFVPEEFWHITVTLKMDDQPAIPFAWTRGRFFDRLFVFLIYQRGWQQAKLKAKVSSIERKRINKYRPMPLTTVDLQKDCARYFKMSAKRALDAAEKLYNKGFLSYPRTETNSFPKGFDHDSLVSRQTQDASWGSYAQRLIRDGIQEARSGSKDDNAHPPIHPVNYTNIHRAGTEWTADESKVYEYVVRRYLACVSQDAVGSQSTCILEWGETNELFRASGVIVEQLNFLEVYPYVKWTSSRQMPPLTEGQEVQLHSARMGSGKTTKPQYITETELIALMDANGIGTDATIAEHIDKIIAREYVTKTKSGSVEVLVPTPLGMGLIDGLDKMPFQVSLSKPYLRRYLEQSLQSICNGASNKDTVIEEFINIYRSAFQTLAARMPLLQSTCRSIIREFG
ncbi:hypothetical protein DIURU_004803 [Diutina rugosa]|uniref:DNA topoisomerase n=1 Tax=Diutina rugosa TaxID=5481 RepID=A0A642UF95_DIURU|nr:uncharacterized protein DIURU_004803 [Diutina rugosa]KAA8897950.1 hypothetical protein DIURU_004803 [Diutina rugosa]